MRTKFRIEAGCTNVSETDNLCLNVRHVGLVNKNFRLLASSGHALQLQLYFIADGDGVVLRQRTRCPMKKA